MPLKIFSVSASLNEVKIKVTKSSHQLFTPFLKNMIPKHSLSGIILSHTIYQMFTVPGAVYSTILWIISFNLTILLQNKFYFYPYFINLIKTCHRRQFGNIYKNIKNGSYPLAQKFY